MSQKLNLRILVLSPFLFLVLAALAIYQPGRSDSASPSHVALSPPGPSADPALPNPVVLTDDQGEYPLGLYLDILEDPGGELTIEDVASQEFDSRFKPSQVEVPNYGYTQSVYWARFRLDNGTRQTHDWLLEQGFANTQYLDLYTSLPDGRGFAVAQSGILRPPATRGIPHQHIIFNLTLPVQSQETFYVRFQNGASMTLDLTLWKKDAFLAASQEDQVWNGIFFGLLIGLFIYNLFLLVSFRDATYLYFEIALGASILFFLSYDGLAGIYLVPDSYFLVRYLLPLFLTIMFSSMLLFADNFLEIKQYSPKIYRVNLGILAVWLALLLVTPLSSYYIQAVFMAPWGMVTAMAILIAAIVSLRRGSRPTRYFVVAWSGLLIAYVLVLLVREGLVPSTPSTENALRVGLAWMAVSSSIALADRINLFKAESEYAEKKLAQILESLPIGVVLYGSDHKPRYVNKRTIEILNNPASNIQVDVDAGRSLAQAIPYFSLKVAGGEEDYPLENLPVYHALEGEPAFADDIEVDQGDKRVPLEIWASPIKDDSGKVQSAVVAFQDISLRQQTELARHISETRFRVIAENNFDGIAFMGRDREVLYVSPSYQRLVGKTAEEMIGQSGIGFVHPEDRDYTAKMFNELLQQPNTRITAEYRIPHRDGSWIWVETFGINLLDNPHVQAVVLNSHNITARKEAEAEQAEYHKHLETLVEKRTAELSAVNEQLQLRLDWLSAVNLVNQIMARSADFNEIFDKIIEIINQLLAAQGSFILELASDGEKLKVLAHSCRDLSGQDFNGTALTLPTRIMSEAESDQLHSAILSRDEIISIGGPFGRHMRESNIQKVAIVPLTLREQVLGFLGLEMQDGSSPITTEESDLLSIFSADIAHLIEDSRLYEQTKALITEQERNRLARELHDSVTQTLFTASVLAEATPRIWEKDQSIARTNMEKLSLLIRGALAEMRSLLIELRDTEFFNQDLKQLLRTLVEAARTRSHAEFVLTIQTESGLPEEVTEAFYRIAREAINNVIVHARAKRVDVSLVEDQGQTILRIRDNGIGFDPHTIREGHLGIRIMEERAGQIGGDLQIHSRLDQGAEISLAWPGDRENGESGSDG